MSNSNFFESQVALLSFLRIEPGADVSGVSPPHPVVGVLIGSFGTGGHSLMIPIGGGWGQASFRST